MSPYHGCMSRTLLDPATKPPVGHERSTNSRLRESPCHAGAFLYSDLKSSIEVGKDAEISQIRLLRHRKLTQHQQQ